MVVLFIVWNTVDIVSSWNGEWDFEVVRRRCAVRYAANPRFNARATVIREDRDETTPLTSPIPRMAEYARNLRGYLVSRVNCTRHPPKLDAYP